MRETRRHDNVNGDDEDERAAIEVSWYIILAAAVSAHFYIVIDFHVAEEQHVWIFVGWLII